MNSLLNYIYLHWKFVFNPARQKKHGDTHRKSHAKEERQETRTGANDDEYDKYCPKNYSYHGCIFKCSL